MLYKYHYYEVGDFKVIHTQSSSDISNIALKFNFGSSIEKTHEHGLAHMIEHNLFKENKIHGDSITISNKFRSLGYSNNAFTSHNVTCYHASGLSTHLSEALHLLTEMVFLPSLTEEDFNKERNPILNEWEIANDDKISIFMNMTSEYLYGKDLYHEILGNKKTIKQMQVEWMRKFHSDLYSVGNMTYVIDDKRSPNQIKSILKKSLFYNDKTFYGDPRLLEDRQKSISVPIFPVKIKKFKLDTDTGVVMYNIPSKNILNFKDYLVTSLADRLLSNLLYDVIRDKKGLPTYAIGASLVTRTKGLENHSIYSIVSEEAIPKVKEEFESLLLDRKNIFNHIDDVYFKNNKLVYKNSVIKAFSLNPFHYFINKDTPIYPTTYKDIIKTYDQISYEDVLNKITSILSVPGVYTELNKKV